jgi:adenine phosphoribosyltransferase
MDFKNYIQSHLDFPKPGVLFWDFSPLLASPDAFASAIQEIASHYREQRITKIAAIEAKGFTIGSALAHFMRIPLQLVRKPGLIPGEVDHAKFVKEYGFGEYQVKSNSFSSEDRVLVVYDIMAGPGASRAALQLIESQGARVVGCSYIVELEYLRGREELPGYDLFSLVKIKEIPKQ